MATASKVSGADIKRAIETRDGKALASFYSANAVINIIDRNNTPSRPRELRGGSEIAAYWDDICGREMTHSVNVTISEGDHLAFSEACAYPDGTKVFCAALADLKDGKITRQTVVQAWDE